MNHKSLKLTNKQLIQYCLVPTIHSNKGPVLENPSPSDSDVP